MTDNQKPKQNTFTTSIVKGIIGLVLMIVIMLAVLFVSAGTLRWWEAWAYAGQGLFILIFSRTILIIKNPETALERAQAAQKEDVKSWDKLLSPLTSVYLPFVSWIVAGLDKRFGWSPDLPDPVQILALIVLISGSMFGTWAMLANRFFSSHVRIQTDRGHQVVSSGPYRFVRHPAYAGLVLSWIASPVFFSSYWLVVPALVAIAASVVRTALEDRVLLEELPGYQEYAGKVRYRLIPGIW